MTASAGERRRKRTRWIEQLDIVSHEISRAYWHRDVYNEIRREIIERNPEADGGFLASYTRLYLESTMSTVRRLAEHDDRNVSLWRIWDAIARDPKCVSRTEYVEHFADSLGPVAADSYFTEHFGSGDNADADVLDGFKSRLDHDAAAVTTFVNEYVAHRSAFPKVRDVQTAQIVTALDDVAANDGDLRRLLSLPIVMYEHLAVPPGWRASLRGLFPPPA